VGKYTSATLVRVSPVWLFNSTDEQVNSFHVMLSGTISGTDGDVEDDLADWLAGLYSDVVDRMWSGIIHNRTEVLIENSLAPSSILSADGRLDGTQAQEPLAPQNCLLVIGNTANRNRQARKYLPTFCETDWTNGLYGTTPMAAAQSFADYWSASQTMGSGLVINPVVRVGSTSSSVAILTARPLNTPAIQRRRRIGRGR